MARTITARETQGSAGSTASVSRRCIRPVSLESHALACNLFRRNPFRATRWNRRKLDVSLRQLAGLAEILLFLPASKQTAFAMFPTLILRPHSYRYTLQ